MQRCSGSAAPLSSTPRARRRAAHQRSAALYDDSICIDDTKPDKVPFQAFIGIAPRLYMRAFAMPVRKGQAGQWIDWEKIRRRQLPRYHEPSDAYIGKELNWIRILDSREVTS